MAFANPPESNERPASVGEARHGVNPPASHRYGLRAEAALPLVAIIGRVNVGKSTLFNRLARERRALVEDRPGVTRDRVTARVRIDSRDALLVDTGGLDPEAEEGIPAAVRGQVRRAMRDASVILFVVDARDGVLPLDRDIARLLRRAERPVILVANKVDAPAREPSAAEFHALGFAELLAVSAEHSRGIADLRTAIARSLPDLPTPEADAEEGVRVAIVGRPNVGKSSLVNRLLGEDYAIVSEEPGTTRDATDVSLRADGRLVVLTDTAGLRRPGRREERLERGSAWMALRSIERADVAVLLLDAAVGVTDQDARIARVALERGRPLLIALNKWDLVDSPRREREIEEEVRRRLRFIPARVVLKVSARTGAGIRELLPRAFELLEEASPEVPTPELNRALHEALRRREPPLEGRRRLRLFYATQVSRRPFTVLAFVNDPDLAPEHYRRYLSGFLQRRFGVRAAPVRLHLRARREASVS